MSSFLIAAGEEDVRLHDSPNGDLTQAAEFKEGHQTPSRPSPLLRRPRNRLGNFGRKDRA